MNVFGWFLGGGEEGVEGEEGFKTCWGNDGGV